MKGLNFGFKGQLVRANGVCQGQELPYASGSLLSHQARFLKRIIVIHLLH